MHSCEQFEYLPPMPQSRNVVIVVSAGLDSSCNRARPFHSCIYDQNKCCKRVRARPLASLEAKTRLKILNRSNRVGDQVFGVQAR